MRRLRSFIGAACTVLIAAVACNDSDRLVAPPPVLERTADVVPGTDGKTYTLVEGQIVTKKSTVSAWIDRKGGKLIMDGMTVDGQPTKHMLIIPEHAVNKPTLFTLCIASSKHVKVDLSAEAYDKSGALVEVGHKGFRAPVTLALSYANATNVSNPGRLTVLYDPEDNKPYEKLGGTTPPVYTKALVVQLRHFSKYALAMD